MNSAQRRQAQRKFVHVVSMKSRLGDRWLDHDERTDAARYWCRQQFERGSWRYSEHWNFTEFKFAQEKDAVLFALRWS